ncbi:MAG: hypothetical protein WA655_09165 [Candidatus Korobacteraceae bacterium]
MKYTKVISVTLFCIGFVLGSASLTFGQGGAPPYAGLNYEKIALLDWYAANQSTSIKVGLSPYGVAFDGANVWVTDGGSVTKLRAADGAILGTFNVGAYGPGTLVFDGANIWVTSNGGVTKVQASDGGGISNSPTFRTQPSSVARLISRPRSLPRIMLCRYRGV